MHGHELSGENFRRKWEVQGGWGQKGKNWDRCTSIINYIYNKPTIFCHKKCMETHTQGNPNSQSNLEKKNNKFRGITFPDFKLYYKVILIKTVCISTKKENILFEDSLE